MAVRKKGKRWVVDFYLGGRDGRRIRRSAPTRQLAEALERDAKLRELRSELGAEEIKKNTLREFIRLYIKLYSPSKTPRTQKWDSFAFSRITEHW